MSVIELPKPERPAPSDRDKEESPRRQAKSPRISASGRSARAWRWTAGTGIALGLLAAAHIVAQHFVVHGIGGLRTYKQVLDFVANPVMFTLECGFLFAVTIHAMLGIRSVLHDFDLRARTRRRLDRGLWLLGTLTIAWGLILLITLASRS
jgi:succinate dehydrogenase hydrophobic anchor subunit